MWTGETTERAITLWRDGKSAAEIARAIGAVSRSAVLGKLHRLGKNGRNVPTRQQRPSRPKAYVAPKNPRAEKLKNILPAPSLTLRQALTLSLPPLEPRHTVPEIQDGQCKFVCGDPRAPDWAFCARETEGGPYCKHHHAICYQAGTAMNAKKKAA